MNVTLEAVAALVTASGHDDITVARPRVDLGEDLSDVLLANLLNRGKTLFSDRYWRVKPVAEGLHCTCVSLSEQFYNRMRRQSTYDAITARLDVVFGMGALKPELVAHITDATERIADVIDADAVRILTGGAF